VKSTVKPTRIAVLANSWKHSDWCVAGIELTTGKWVRPVTELEDGRVPKRAMKTGGHFPQLRDILDIPLDASGNDFGFACENRTLLSGAWHWHGKIEVEELLPYAERPDCILHNHRRYVTPQEMSEKPVEQRSTLQLIRVDNFTVRDRRRSASEKHQWQGVIVSAGRELELNITDPVLFGRLDAGHHPSSSCLLTLSLGMPYKPLDWPEDAPAPYWKLIAGVIEL